MKHIDFVARQEAESKGYSLDKLASSTDKTAGFNPFRVVGALGKAGAVGAGAVGAGYLVGRGAQALGYEVPQFADEAMGQLETAVDPIRQYAGQKIGLYPVPEQKQQLVTQAVPVAAEDPFAINPWAAGAVGAGLGAGLGAGIGYGVGDGMGAAIGAGAGLLGGGALGYYTPQMIDAMRPEDVTAYGDIYMPYFDKNAAIGASIARGAKKLLGAAKAGVRGAQTAYKKGGQFNSVGKSFKGMAKKGRGIMESGGYAAGRGVGLGGRRIAQYAAKNPFAAGAAASGIAASTGGMTGMAGNLTRNKLSYGNPYLPYYYYDKNAGLGSSIAKGAKTLVTRGKNIVKKPLNEMASAYKYGRALGGKRVPAAFDAMKHGWNHPGGRKLMVGGGIAGAAMYGGSGMGMAGALRNKAAYGNPYMPYFDKIAVSPILVSRAVANSMGKGRTVSSVMKQLERMSARRSSLMKTRTNQLNAINKMKEPSRDSLTEMVTYQGGQRYKDNLKLNPGLLSDPAGSITGQLKDLMVMDPNKQRGIIKQLTSTKTPSPYTQAELGLTTAFRKAKLANGGSYYPYFDKRAGRLATVAKKVAGAFKSPWLALPTAALVGGAYANPGLRSVVGDYFSGIGDAASEMGGATADFGRSLIGTYDPQLYANAQQALATGQLPVAPWYNTEMGRAGAGALGGAALGGLAGYGLGGGLSDAAIGAGLGGLGGGALGYMTAPTLPAPIPPNPYSQLPDEELLNDAVASYNNLFF